MNPKPYEESIDTYKARLEGELKEALAHMVDFNTQDSYEVRHAIRFLRKSLEKAHMYISYMETFCERAIATQKMEKKESK